MSVLDNIKLEHFNTHSKYVSSKDYNEEKKCNELKHTTTNYHHQLQQDLFEENI